ncbi:MAG: folylpolyglutamate synthase/dihydrofolate synthase family protein [Paenibacillaceae bacterium]
MSQLDFNHYNEAIEWIIGRIPFGIRPGLARMEALMERLGNPEHRLKFIHVAGTNGKGSTCAFLTEVLIQSGYDVGTFTSPYIEKYTSRMQYNGVNIPEADLLQLCNKLKPHVDAIAETELGSPTMFEVSTALAILYYATVVYPDYVVWETGLGGRLDSTNIVNPVISVITNVGHDHMEILGNTLELVIEEKAGIIKAGVPVVSAVEQPEAIAVLERICAKQKATLYLMNREYAYQAVSSQLNEQKFNFKGLFRGLDGLGISLNGAHQYKNAAIAIMTLEVLRQYYALIVEDNVLIRALKTTKWPGRLEMISEQPRILLDGAHNPEGAQTLATALQQTYMYKKLHFMMGMMGTKHHSDYLRHILPLVDTLIVTEPNFRNQMDSHRLADLARTVVDELKLEVEIVVEPDWKQAWLRLKNFVAVEDLGVISGTLYLISDVRSWILHESDSEKGW